MAKRRSQILTPGKDGTKNKLLIRRSVKLPKHVIDLFWEYRKNQISWKNDSDLIIQKILEAGRWESVQWLMVTAGYPQLRSWLMRRRGAGLEPKKLRFWQHILELPKPEVNKWVEAFFEDPWGQRLHPRTNGGDTSRTKNMKKPKTMMLVLAEDDPEKEAEFDLEFMLSLSMNERMKIMERIYTEGIKLLKRNGNKNVPTIIARS